MLADFMPGAILPRLMPSVADSDTVSFALCLIVVVEAVVVEVIAVVVALVVVVEVVDVVEDEDVVDVVIEVVVEVLGVVVDVVDVGTRVKLMFMVEPACTVPFCGAGKYSNP